MAKKSSLTKTKKTGQAPKKKMGRPRKEVNWEEFDKLCAIQCTEEEIAAWYDMTIDTLNARCKEEYGQTFSEVYAQKRQEGFSSLRRYQFKRATGGSDTMLIWLGKQYLGQKDKHELGLPDLVKIMVVYGDDAKTDSEAEEAAPETS